MKRPYQKFLFFMCDRPAVDDTGDHRRQHLGKPEGVPCAVCAQPVTQQCSQWHDENDVPAQRDDQRFCALAQTLQRTGNGAASAKLNYTNAPSCRACVPLSAITTVRGSTPG